MGSKADSKKVHRKIINLNGNSTAKGSYIISMGKREDLEKVITIIQSEDSSDSYSLNSSLSDEIKSRAFMSVSPVRRYEKRSELEHKDGSDKPVLNVQTVKKQPEHFSPQVVSRKISKVSLSDKRLSIGSRGHSASRRSREPSIRMSRFANNIN
jgi:hypothetical protein